MSKSKILVIDDDPKLSELLAVILNRVGGYDVQQENRPFAALATARNYLPNLVLLDVDMPGKDGGMVSAEMHADPVLTTIPIIFVTSLVGKNEAGMRNGRLYVSKPVDPALLLEAVRSICPRFQPDAV